MHTDSKHITYWDLPYDTKFWREKNCNRIAKKFLSKIFSFERFSMRYAYVHRLLYLTLVCSNAWMAFLKYFKLKTSDKQPLLHPNGELSAKIPSSGISSANSCVGKLRTFRPCDEQR